MLIKGIILDYDGVLLDSFRGGLRRIRNLCAEEEIPFGRDSRQRLTEAWGKPGIELLQIGLGINLALATEINKRWIRLDNADPPSLIPGTREVLLWLRNNNFKVCLLTSRHKGNVEVLLKKQDLFREFAHVCTREDVPYSKPDPRALRPPLEALRDEFNIKDKECVFVGDTPRHRGRTPRRTYHFSGPNWPIPAKTLQQKLWWQARLITKCTCLDRRPSLLDRTKP
ncbi:MAG TPA: HAD family phosphatase [Candidatus Paceibacterota bacterium]|nr:HAD family phosphatase [Candidatus Paceibacterota bacterium]